MIIFERHGDLFESDLQTLVCPVNSVGAMGAGLAKAFRVRYPELYPAYRKAAFSGAFRRWNFYLYSVSDEHKILCLPTKGHWRFPSQLSWVDCALEQVARRYEAAGITSLAIPAIGCGHGKLDWSAVHALIHKWLGPLELEVGIYLP